MLLSLRIENFAIIESTLVDFSKGFNVLTGETGAGKSILMDALGLVLGDRAQKGMIRQGSEKAEIEAVFSSLNPKILEILREYEMDEEELLIIRKNIYTDRPSISRINGKSVSNSILSKVASYLADSTHQQQNQSLLNSNSQLFLLDKFAGQKQKDDLKELRVIVDAYQEKKKFISLQDMDEQTRLREQDLLLFQIKELEELNLQEDEDIQLELEFKKANSVARLQESFQRMETISEGSMEMGLRSLLDKYVEELGRIQDYDKEYAGLYRRAEGLRYEWLDIFNEARNFYENLVVDEQRIFEIESRLNEINRIKRKYGNTFMEIQDKYFNLKERLKFLMDYEEKMEVQKQELESLKSRAVSISKNLRKRRKEVSQFLEKKMGLEMQELNINEGKFSIKFEETDLSNTGMDKITYYISTNRGEELKPLSEVASGGEMSRILLAFKSIMAEMDETETLIFDEIDVGMSGKTAKIVADKMKKLSASSQLIVISHLPQVVAVADEQYQITKQAKEGRAVSTIEKLSFEARVDSLATMISGVDEGIARETAEKMLRMNQ